MSVVVQKYGGSSVADVEKLRAVADQVIRCKQAGHGVVVVVSAMGKTTDRLVAMARDVCDAPQPRELDMLLTAGERISMAMLSLCIEARGESAISFTGSQSGIITEPKHQGARVIEVKPYRILEALEAGRIVIVAGYQGVSTAREVTTLGRGGSDTTAVALAAALHADRCEIYSDVDGVYSADPRVCAQAQHIAEIDYEVMQTMAGAGAKVLNAQAVEFAKRAGITIHALKAGAPSGQGTLVSASGASPAVTAVVGNRGVFRVRGPRDAVTATLRELPGQGLRPIHTRLGEGEFEILADGADRAAEGLPAIVGCRVMAMALVTVVGPGVGSDVEVLAAVHEASASAGEGPLAWAASHQALAVTVPPEECDALVTTLHQRLIA